jgi:hypothetical protein
MVVAGKHFYFRKSSLQQSSARNHFQEESDTFRLSAELVHFGGSEKRRRHDPDKNGKNDPRPSDMCIVLRVIGLTRDGNGSIGIGANYISHADGKRSHDIGKVSSRKILRCEDGRRIRV